MILPQTSCPRSTGYWPNKAMERDISYFRALAASSPAQLTLDLLRPLIEGYCKELPLVSLIIGGNERRLPLELCELSQKVLCIGTTSDSVRPDHHLEYVNVSPEKTYLADSAAGLVLWLEPSGTIASSSELYRVLADGGLAAAISADALPVCSARAEASAARFLRIVDRLMKMSGLPNTASLSPLISFDPERDLMRTVHLSQTAAFSAEDFVGAVANDPAVRYCMDAYPELMQLHLNEFLRDTERIFSGDTRTGYICFTAELAVKNFFLGERFSI